MAIQKWKKYNRWHANRSEIGTRNIFRVLTEHVIITSMLIKQYRTWAYV